MRKLLLGLVAILGILTLLGVSHSKSGRHYHQSYRKIIKQEKTLANKSIAIKQVEQNGHTVILAPEGYGTSIYRDLIAWNQAVLSKRALKANQFAVLRPEINKTNIKNVSLMTIHRTVYQKERFTYRKVSSKVIRKQHVNEDLTAFTLENLLNGRTERLSEEMSKISSGANYTGHDAQAEISQNGYSSDGFDVKDKHLIVDKVSVLLENLSDVVNDSYLQGDDLKAVVDKRNQGPAIALTFDDGPSAETTPQVLDILKRYKAKATFYMLGSKVAGNEDLIKRMVSEGHEIGNHSWDHPNLSKLTSDQIAWQVNTTNDTIASIIGQPPHTLRPPYGATNDTVRAVTGMPEVLWTVDTLDWQSKNTQAILAKVQSQANAGGIILMHDIHQTTVNALPTVLDYLVSQGYHFVTIDELNQN